MPGARLGSYSGMSDGSPGTCARPFCPFAFDAGAETDESAGADEDEGDARPGREDAGVGAEGEGEGEDG